MVKIANLNLPGNIVLSPMAGITDAPFRHIARLYKADYTISEMISSKIELWQSSKTRYRLQDNYNQNSFKITQIAGGTPKMIAEAAIKCEEFGSDILEINMGCPAKKVCNVLAGSALLRDEKLVKNILTKAAESVSIPVTLKTRLGWDHSNYNILSIAKIAEDVGIKAITIHGRTRFDMYNGEASYDLIKAVKQNLTIPVFANGDITSPEKAKYVLEYTNADGIYIGRASLGKPWIFSQIKDYLATGIYQDDTHYLNLQLLTLHLNLLYEHYGEFMGTKIAKKHIKWYFKNLAKKSNQLELALSEFNLSESMNQQIDIVSDIFAFSQMSLG